MLSLSQRPVPGPAIKSTHTMHSGRPPGVSVLGHGAGVPPLPERLVEVLGNAATEGGGSSDRLRAHQVGRRMLLAGHQRFLPKEVATKSTAATTTTKTNNTNNTKYYTKKAKIISAE